MHFKGHVLKSHFCFSAQARSSVIWGCKTKNLPWWLGNMTRKKKNKTLAFRKVEIVHKLVQDWFWPQQLGIPLCNFVLVHYQECVLAYYFLFWTFSKVKNFAVEQSKVLSYNVNLGSKNSSASFKEECEVASEVKTSGKPPALRNVELSTALISKRLDIENGIVKGNCVQRCTISNCSKFHEGHTMWSCF